MMYTMLNYRTGEVASIEAESEADAVMFMQSQDVDFQLIREED